YVRHVNAKLLRRGGEDSSDVPALWIYALRTGNWDMIPASGGDCTPARAWFLSLESRSAKADRFAFLPCVKPEFSGARELLKNLGVVTIEEARIPRLARALHEVAGQVTGASPEDLRHIDAIVSDLYEAIEARLKGGESPDAVKNLLDAPVPLLKGGQIGCASLREVSPVVIDDDPIQQRYIRRFHDFWVIPKRFQQTYDNLVTALRGFLGRERVVRVSEMPINVHFSPLERGIPLLEYLKQ